jgi:hypothetical protein
MPAQAPAQPPAQPAPTKSTQTAFHLPAMVAPQLSTGNASPTATDLEMTMPPGAEEPLADNKPTSTGESEVVKKDGEGKEGKPSSAKKRLADLIP